MHRDTAEHDGAEDHSTATNHDCLHWAGKFGERAREDDDPRAGDTPVGVSRLGGETLAALDVRPVNVGCQPRYPDPNGATTGTEGIARGCDRCNPTFARGF